MLEQLLLGVLPALTAAVVLLGPAWGPRRTVWRAWRERANALALAAGSFGSYLALQGLPPLPPITGTQAFAWMLVVLGVVSLWPRLDRRPVVLTGLLALATMAVVGHRLWRVAWEGAEGYVQVGATVGIALVVDASLARAGGRAGRLLSPALALVVTTTAAVVLSLGGSALLGQLAGALATVLGVGSAAAAWNPGFVLGRAAGRVVAIAFVALLASGSWFVEIDVGTLACTAAAVPLGVLVAEAPARPARTGARAVLGLAAAGVLCALAIWRVAGGPD